MRPARLSTRSAERATHKPVTAAHGESQGSDRTGPSASVVYRSDRIEVTPTNVAAIATEMPLAVEAAAGTKFEPGRVGLFTLGNDFTRRREVSIAPLR